jgi:hypothetical protein
MSMPPGSPRRTDFKSGDPARLVKGLGPQGDAMRINNFVRLVRGGPGL